MSPLKNNVYGESLNFNSCNKKANNENNYSHAPVSPLQTYNNSKDHNINFSFSPKLPHYQHQNYPSPSSSQ